jgi:hypothetical protein
VLLPFELSGWVILPDWSSCLCPSLILFDPTKSFLCRDLWSVYSERQGQTYPYRGNDLTSWATDGVQPCNSFSTRGQVRDERLLLGFTPDWFMDCGNLFRLWMLHSVQCDTHYAEGRGCVLEVMNGYQYQALFLISASLRGLISEVTFQCPHETSIPRAAMLSLLMTYRGQLDSTPRLYLFS